MVVSHSRIRISILLPLSILIVAFVAYSVRTLYDSLQGEIERTVLLQAHRVESVFHAIIQQETVFLQSHLEVLQADVNLQQAFLERNRPALLGYALPIFTNLRETYRVTHFYVTDLDRVNFLRAHNPGTYDDVIGRYTTLEAERTGAIASGVELGVSGLFTLRAVIPWVVEGQRIGYLELGMEIDHIVSLTNEVMESDLLLMIEKPFVDRERWEAGMQGIGREVNWDQFSNYVIVDSTLPAVPPVIDDALLADLAVGNRTSFETPLFDDQHFQGRTVPLMRADGVKVGEILILTDVTQNYDQRESTITTAVILSVVVAGMVFAFFYVYIGRIQHMQTNLVSSLQSARQEVEHRVSQSAAQFRELETVNDEIQQRIRIEQRQRQMLQELAEQVEKTVTNLNGAAAAIVASTAQQVASSSEQETAITQTAATVEQVRMTVRQTAERAESVSSSAQNAISVSQRGAQAVNESIESMEQIEERVQNIAMTILALSERTQQIGEIIDSVNAIAGQSKLLALNASIEAARAGEEGRGFAVVASEVRQLAEQSRQATARVGDILREIQQATNTAVMVTEEGSKGVQIGVLKATSAGEAIRDLAVTLQDTAQAMIQIVGSTHQQINGMDLLVHAMRQIREASNQTLISSRQTEQTARDLSDLSSKLEQTLALYDL
jgi:methyl-accepting chemotaxis protein